MKFSITTISYNSIDFIEKTINSVLEQKNVDFEYLLVDGGSTDGTIDIINSYASRDDRVRWISERDAGISDAMNKGIRMAKGEIIAHIHSDDFYPHPFVLKKVDTAFSRKKIWVTGGMTIVGGNDEILDNVRAKQFSYSNLLKGNCIYHPSTFILRDSFDRVGLFNTSLKYAMDYDMWLRMARIAPPVLLDESLSCFRAHASSLSTAYSNKAYSEAWVVRRGYLGCNPLKLLLEYYRFLSNRNKYIRYNESLLTKKYNARQ